MLFVVAKVHVYVIVALVAHCVDVVVVVDDVVVVVVILPSALYWFWTCRARL